MKILFSFSLLLILSHAIVCAQSEMETYENEDMIALDSAAEVPVLKGCDTSMSSDERMTCMQEIINNIITRNFWYPETAMKHNVSGTVVVHFEIGKDGTISVIRILKEATDSRLDELLEKPELTKKEAKKVADIKASIQALSDEALRLAEMIPPAIVPGYYEGKPVRIIMAMPVTFSLM